MKIKKYLLAVISGVFLVFAFPGINMSILAWFALVPLLVAVYDANWKDSIWLGFITGIIYTLGIFWWFMALHPFSTWFWVLLGYFALALYLSSYVLIFAVCVNYVSKYWVRSRFGYIFLVGIVWTAMEILKGHVATGLPWADLGQSQWKFPVIIQISSITGMYGVTFLVAIINAMIANFLIDFGRWKESLKATIVPILLLLISIIYGLIAMNGSSEGEKIKVALVPGNINQMDKLKSWGDPQWIFDLYTTISDLAADKEPDMIVWPETSVPKYVFRFEEVPDELKERLIRWNTHLMMGTPHAEFFPESKTFNSAFLLSPEGNIIDKYYKIHLVPVSEYFPMKRYLPESWQKLVSGISDWDHGEKYTVFNMGKARFGCVICFESVFPSIFRTFMKQDVNIMGIITNDAWFKGTFAAEQHLMMAPFRAVETRKAIFRCANNGISCIIDPYGRIIKQINYNSIESYLIGDVELNPGRTFYSKFGDYLPWGCLVMTIFLVFWTWLYKKSN